jgi:thiol-disulfide isomerase/thioredoxin
MVSQERFQSLVRSRSWFAFIALVVVAGVAWIWLSAVRAASTTEGRISSPREGFLAPDFDVDLLGGGEIALSELKGKAVIVNLWASWCPPCREEMPAMHRVYEANRGRGLEIMAVNMTWQDSEKAAADFVSQFALTFPIPLDRDGFIARKYLLRALPSTFFVDREGVIQKVIIGGPISEATIQTTVEELLD